MIRQDAGACSFLFLGGFDWFHSHNVKPDKFLTTFPTAFYRVSVAAIEVHNSKLCLILAGLKRLVVADSKEVITAIAEASRGVAGRGGWGVSPAACVVGGRREGLGCLLRLLR